MSKKKKTGPVEITLPKGVLKRINLGQSFAEYDKVLTQKGVFVTTPAMQAALEPMRSKCFFVGRRGTGKTAINVHLSAVRQNVVQLNPDVFTLLESRIDPKDFRNQGQKPFTSLVACFKRALIDEAIADQVQNGQLSFQQLPEGMSSERNYIENYSFDSRVLSFMDDLFDALEKKQDKEWLRHINKAKQIPKEAEALTAKSTSERLVLIDRIDDSWDGSEAAVFTLMGLMHACVQLAATSTYMRPMLFLRENIFERIRALDSEFARIETCVVSLDWTRALLLEMIDRRLQLPLNPKPPVGATWDLLFEKPATGSSADIVFEFCMQRPRDVITYCAFAIEAAQSALHEKVMIQDLHDARLKFSESRFKDLGDEYSENYPQLQVILSSFHGLGTEWTVPAITAFIQKLLGDAEVMRYCGSWFNKVAAPHLFINLLYSVGFVGIRNGSTTEFRGVGLRKSSPPPTDASTILVIHPSYAPALELQNKLIGDLDHVVLQKNGMLIDIPDGIDLATYQSKLATLLKEIDETPHGKDFDEEYERIVGEVLRLCFFRWLNNVEPQCRDLDGRVIRDWIVSNVADNGFWNMMREKYGANQVIWECKNYADLQASDFHQALYYMNDSIGRLVVMCFRGDEIKPFHYQHIRIMSRDKPKMVLLLRDKDLKVFVRQAMNQKVKEDHIREIFDTTQRKI